ncbi:MAG: hypothetical protein M5U31_04515 [Acidimicrobiia bacterium]|nr:hypothetical protein [Acidimicrobiia bacterium]
MNELIESLRLREPIRDENVDVLVEAISSGAAAVTEYRRGRRMESRYDPEDRSLPTGGP